MTIRENKLILEGLNVAYIGDGNNMCQSLLVGCLTLGMNFSIACPDDYKPSEYYINKGNEIADWENINFTISSSVEEAIKNADVVITDVWASMWQEEEVQKRAIAFDGFQVNSKVMSLANKNAIVLHCLPAHREEEITEDILEQNADIIFEEAENRLHAQKAILVKLLA